MAPRVGRSSPAISFRVVVFPQPLGPSRVTNSPAGISMSAMSTTSVSLPNTFWSPSSRTFALRPTSLAIVFSPGVGCPRSELDRSSARSQATHEAALDEREQEYDRQRKDYGRGHQRTPLEPHVIHVGVQSQRQRHLTPGSNQDERPQIIAPGENENEDEDQNHAGDCLRQEHIEQRFQSRSS